MKLSTKARYSTRALLDLARHQREEPIPLKDIVQRQEISLNYLGHLKTPFIVAGIVRSSRGSAGGVQLARPPRDIKLSEVIRLVKGSKFPVECVDNPKVCPRSELCATRDVWIVMERALSKVLSSITLLLANAIKPVISL